MVCKNSNIKTAVEVMPVSFPPASPRNLRSPCQSHRHRKKRSLQRSPARRNPKPREQRKPRRQQKGDQMRTCLETQMIYLAILQLPRQPKVPRLKGRRRRRQKQLLMVVVVVVVVKGQRERRVSPHKLYLYCY